MELGVDISAMNVVYMRNVPPTPANYAQRSGRAGRSGQAAFIVAYCAAQSPHDQYFFRQPKEMVDGVVRPPSIDLTNPDLVESHLHAEWLAASGVDLNSSIALNLDMAEPGKPLLPEHWESGFVGRVKHAGSERTCAVLEMLAADFSVQSHRRGSQTPRPMRRRGRRSATALRAAFDRWRDLLAAAERQSMTLPARSGTIRSRPRSVAPPRCAKPQVTPNQALAKRIGDPGLRLLRLPLSGHGRLSAGYNFPRLPLMAFVPGARSGTGERYIQRARSSPSPNGFAQPRIPRGTGLSRRSGAPEGGGGGPNGELPTFSAAICPMCGAGHEGEAPGGMSRLPPPARGLYIIRQLHRIENVGTREAERITANDEERRRQGFDLQTTFSFAQARAVTTRALEDLAGEVLTATFAPATLVRRIQQGPPPAPE